MVVLVTVIGCQKQSSHLTPLPADSREALEHGVGKFYVVTKSLRLDGQSGHRVISADDDSPPIPSGVFVGILYPGTIIYAYAIYESPAEDANPRFTPIGVQYRIVSDWPDPLRGRPLVAGEAKGAVYKMHDDWVRELTPLETKHLVVPPLSDARYAEGDPINIHDEIRMLRYFSAGQTHRPTGLPSDLAQPSLNEERAGVAE